MNENRLKDLLLYPLMRDRDTEECNSALLRRTILKKKRFVRKIYQEWYKTIANALPIKESVVLEIGSSGGFFNEFIPKSISSDIVYCPWNHAVLDGMQLPFKNESIQSIVMVNVFHHFSKPKNFLSESIRCLKPGGCIFLVEPWVTPWSKLVFKLFHHEPFDHTVQQWDIPHNKDINQMANNALPWIVFQRDRKKFEKDFPLLKITFIKLCMPFRYLLSGGISMRGITPNWSFGMWRILEWFMTPLLNFFAMFAYVKIVKK